MANITANSERVLKLDGNDNLQNIDHLSDFSIKCIVAYV